MKVKDFINGQFQGNDTITLFFTREVITHTSGVMPFPAKNGMGNRGTYPKQQAVAIRFKAVQVFT